MRYFPEKEATALWLRDVDSMTAHCPSSVGWNHPVIGGNQVPTRLGFPSWLADL
jgi:hypothetical protein